MARGEFPAISAAFAPVFCTFLSGSPCQLGAINAAVLRGLVMGVHFVTLNPRDGARSKLFPVVAVVKIPSEA